jgi:hypothetical protein
MKRYRDIGIVGGGGVGVFLILLIIDVFFELL